MIANPKWFSPRKYTGWGLTPNCWQGWAYIGMVALPIALTNYIPLNDDLKTGFMFLWALFFTIDFIDIMRKVKRDERDTIHEAIAERNALWFMIAALIIGIAFQSGKSIANQNWSVDPVILVALFGAMIVKAITHFYLRDK